MIKLEKRQSIGYVDKAVDEAQTRFKFILSTETVDRVGDVIRASGWRLSNFRKNPIALAYHDHTKPIGRWRNVKIDGTQLVGELELAPDDVGPMQRAINALLRGGFLKSVSVGFTPLEYEYRNENDPWSGIEFLKQELNEVSVVSVPANPEALALAKSLDLSPQHLKKLFDGTPGSNPRALSRRAKTGLALAKVRNLIAKIEQVESCQR